MEQILGAVKEVATQSGEIKTAMLTILGILVTIGIAWAIVSGLRK